MSGFVRLEELETLPGPVRRYFRRVLRDGQPVVATTEVRQEGHFLLKDTPDGWRPFSARQRFSSTSPTFVWDAQVRMIAALPWPCATVRDAYEDGHGSTRASLFSFIPLVNAAGAPAIDEAALQRYLAEAVWFPTALLPSEYVAWSAIDDTHAIVTITDGATSARLEIAFNGQGDVVSCYAPARSRMLNGKFVATPWGGTVGNYVTRDGMRVPSDSEVYWIVDGERRPYFRAKNIAVRYDFADRGDDAAIERYIALPDIAETHEITINAPAELVMEIAQTLDIQSLPVVRAIFWLRGKILGASQSPRKPQGLMAEMTALGWRRLAERPGRAIVMGSVAQPWQANVQFVSVPAECFISYDVPDRVKIAWTLEVESLGENLTRFRTQTRAETTDLQARTKFLRYWRAFGIGTAVIRLLLLRALRREAQRRYRAISSPKSPS